MALPEYFPPGYGKFAMKWSNADSDFPAVCTFGFRNIGNQTAAACNAALQAIWYNGSRPSAISGMSDQYTNVSSYVLLKQVGYETSDLDDIGTTGTSADPAPSAANSIVVRKETDRAGKRYRGRFGWPPFLLHENDVDAGGRIDLAAVGPIQTQFTAALNAMTAASLPMVLIHHRITIDEEPIPTVVLSLNVQNLMGIQRRRQRR